MESYIICRCAHEALGEAAEIGHQHFLRASPTDFGVPVALALWLMAADLGAWGLPLGPSQVVLPYFLLRPTPREGGRAG